MPSLSATMAVSDTMVGSHKMDFGRVDGHEDHELPAVSRVIVVRIHGAFERLQSRRVRKSATPTGRRPRSANPICRQRPL